MTYSNPYASTSSPTNFIAFSGMGMRKGGRAMLMPSNYQGDGSTLSLDFTTGVLDPRLTFSRASTATFVNSSGYVEYAGANLVLQSGDLSQNGVGQWTTRTNLTLTGWNGLSDPFGGSTAVKIIPNTTNATHNVGTADISMSIGIPYTVSVYVKAAGYSIVGLVTTNSNARAHFNLATQTSAGYGVTNTRTITDVGNGWYRITMSFTVANGPLVSLLIYAMNTATDPVANSFAAGAGDTDGVLAWGAQVNPSSTAQTYYPTTTAAYYAPRFDYSPTNIGEPRGLLVEGQTKNVLYYSQDVTQATRWTIQGGLPSSYTSVSATGGTAPDNTNTANLCTESTANNSRSIYQGLTAAAGTYTASVWVKAGTGSTRYIRLVLPSAAGNFVYVTVNISTGAVTQAAAAVGTASAASATVTPYPGSWYHIRLTGTLAAAVNFVFIVPLDSATPSVNTGDYGREAYLGNGSTFLIWGCQLEAGSGASSYIPTGASQVTRNAENCYMNDISALSYSATNGSMFYEGSFSKSNSASYPTRMGFLTNAGGDPAFEIFVNGTTIFSGIRSAAANNEITRTIATNTNYKFATSFNAAASSQVRCSINGAAVVGSGTSALTATRTPTVFGFTRSGYDLYFPSGTIKTAKYWNTTLTDADLVSKST